MVMRAKDLMVGDWVQGFIPDTYSKVVGIINEYRLAIIGGGAYMELSIDDVQPIPLTPEILEKNGWKDISTHTLKGCDTFRLRLEQRSFDYTLTLKMRDYFRLDSYDDRVYTLCEVNFGFKYVHQLQHALRLCGIEKEIII